MFLSTDAGGTGLNLQTADTVVNLELPWNPAVLEQRIARVHRMGQNRPVRVINFVTRGTIEEKVLRTVEAKQALFTGLFTGDADEIPFEAINTGGFLDTMRELVGARKGGVRSRESGTGVRSQESGNKGRSYETSSSPLTPHPSLGSPLTHDHVARGRANRGRSMCGTGRFRDKSANSGRDSHPVAGRASCRGRETWVGFR